MRPSTPRTVPPDAESVHGADSTRPSDKPRLFDHYWETRDLSSADLRTRLRIEHVDAMLTRMRGRLLDVGCGRGAVASHFAERGYSVTATDISPLALEWTQKQHLRIQTALLDIETEDISGRYDVILCLEVLQQVRHPVTALRKMVMGLAEGGDLVVSLPNEFHLARRLGILFGFDHPGGVEDTHIKLYNVAEHGRLFAACGLDICCTRAQSIVPPRWWGGRLHEFGNTLAGLWPELFSLSVVYHLIPNGSRRGS